MIDTSESAIAYTSKLSETGLKFKMMLLLYLFQYDQLTLILFASYYLKSIEFSKLDWGIELMTTYFCCIISAKFLVQQVTFIISPPQFMVLECTGSLEHPKPRDRGGRQRKILYMAWVRCIWPGQFSFIFNHVIVIEDNNLFCKTFVVPNKRYVFL